MSASAEDRGRDSSIAAAGSRALAPAHGTHATAAMLRRHRRSIAVGLFLAAIVGFIYFVVPQLSGMSHTLHRLRHADPWWIAGAVVSETVSLAAYIYLFRTVFSCHGVRIGWRVSSQINLAGTVASKLFAAAGAGGVALTVWALRASGLGARAIARRMITFELLLYAVFASALLIVGTGLRAGVFEGTAPWTLTLIPAAIGGVMVAGTVALRALPSNLEHRLAQRAASGRHWRAMAKLAAAPATLRDATSIAFGLVRRRELGVAGAIAYWGFDIGALWASLHAFGAPPPFATIVMAYFVGQLANVLPIPGGIGGVEGGMIGALLAFGAQGSLAVLGVLAYRLISFWLPTLPGAVAYIRLRRTVERWRAEHVAEQVPS